MSDMTESQKSVPLPRFDGDEEKFELFWPKFEAYASLKGFGDSILINPDPNLPVKEKTFDEDPVKAAKEKTALRNNKLAVASFTIAFTTVALMNRVSESKTEDFPSGLAYKIVQGLIERYRPSDRLSKLEALKELDSIEMESDEEPDDLFNKIAALKQRYKKSRMDDANYVNHVIKIVPKKYNSMIAVEIKTLGDQVKLEDIQKAMKTSYRMNNNKGITEGRSKVKGDEGDTESALIAKLMKAMKAEGEGAFFGANSNSKCYKCGKPGHKAFECRSKGSQNKQNKWH
jgi:hypothetical protein